MKRLAFAAIIVGGMLGFLVGLYGRALWDDGWPL